MKTAAVPSSVYCVPTSSRRRPAHQRSRHKRWRLQPIFTIKSVSSRICVGCSDCSSGGAWHKRAQVAGAVAGLFLIAAVAAHGTSTRTEASIEDTENFAEIAGAQPNWAITTKEADLCSKTTDDCSKTGCCKTTGYKCIKEKSGGKCMKYCPAFCACTVLGAKITFDTKERTPCSTSQCTPKILAA